MTHLAQLLLGQPASLLNGEVAEVAELQEALRPVRVAVRDQEGPTPRRIDADTKPLQLVVPMVVGRIALLGIAEQLDGTLGDVHAMILGSGNHAATTVAETTGSVQHHAA